MFLLENTSLAAMKNILDASSLRQRVIANNLANLNTPGFKKSVVSFEEHFKTALNKRIPLITAHANHIGGGRGVHEVRPEAVPVTHTSITPCGNNVNLDQEMVNLTANQIRYNATIQFIDGFFSGRQRVIRGGR
ncbi:MAG: flagellar basal body rod protein FlgB [Desulfotomaculum sp.]|nr:flagellar basal body rod protein FlgB [Desulfotomaculum sp.]